MSGCTPAACLRLKPPITWWSTCRSSEPMLKPKSGEFTTIEELDGSILMGSPDDIVKGVQRYQELGCDLLVFDLRMRFPDYLQQIEILAKEVLPRVQTAAAAAR